MYIFTLITISSPNYSGHKKVMKMTVAKRRVPEGAFLRLNLLLNCFSNIGRLVESC